VGLGSLLGGSVLRGADRETRLGLFDYDERGYIGPRTPASEQNNVKTK
jgi:hypothetical protein